MAQKMNFEIQGGIAQMKAEQTHHHHPQSHRWLWRGCLKNRPKTLFVAAG